MYNYCTINLKIHEKSSYLVGFINAVRIFPKSPRHNCKLSWNAIVYCLFLDILILLYFSYNSTRICATYFRKRFLRSITIRTTVTRSVFYSLLRTITKRKLRRLFLNDFLSIAITFSATNGYYLVKHRHIKFIHLCAR